MPAPRPKSIWLLIIVFAWSAFKGIELLVRGSSTSDRMLFDHAGLGWLFVPLVVTIAALDFITLWFLIRPAMIGQRIGLLSVGLSALESVVAFLIAGANPDVPGVNLLLLLVSLGLSEANWLSMAT